MSFPLKFLGFLLLLIKEKGVLIGNVQKGQKGLQHRKISGCGRPHSHENKGPMKTGISTKDATSEGGKSFVALHLGDMRAGEERGILQAYIGDP